MITEAALFAAAIAIPAALIALAPRRWVALAMAAWAVSPLFAFVGVVVWEGITRPAVDFSFENALLGFSLISAIFILPWVFACAVGFGAGFVLRRVFRNSTGAARRQPDSAAPAPAAPTHITPTTFAVGTAPISQPAPAAANDASSDDTEEWRQAHIGFEMDDLTIGGLGVWKHAWRSVDRPALRLPHPAYPEQMHDFTVQEIAEGSTVVRFAVSELSNGVWGFYVPRHHALDTCAFSIDGSLRYEQRHGEVLVGQPGTRNSWAVLLDASTGRVLVDCADWPESRITGNADASLSLRLRQENGEALFRVNPAIRTFRNEVENGDDLPLFQLAGTVEQLRRPLGPPGPHYDRIAPDGTIRDQRISPDGTIRVDSDTVEWGNSHWVYTPRVVDISSGKVVLDLWGTDWDATITWTGPRRVSLDFRRYHFSGDLTIELDLANDSYRITREPGGLGELPSGPLADAANAMEASGRRVAVWAAARHAARPVWESGGKPNPFAAWRSALVILLVAIILIAVATMVTMNFAPAPAPEPVLLRPIPKPDLSSSERLRGTALKNSNTRQGAPTR